MKKLPIAIAASAALGIFWFVFNSRAATRTPGYKVIRTDGRFEIRDYPELVVAKAAMEGDEMNRSFGELFRFITGRNASGEKIEMTSPVLVNTSKDQKSMSFIMPEKAVAKGLPKPADDRVSLDKMDSARYAVIRFGGRRSAANEEKATDLLKAWLVDQKIAENGDPIFAYYDPPWTPVFLRRNEVMIQIGRTAQ
jgi:effector-binding domain-containing protein